MYVIDNKIDKRLFRLRDELSSLTLNYLYESGNTINQNKRLTLKGSVSCFILNTFYKSTLGVTDRFGITLNRNHYSRSAIINGRDTKRKVSYQYTRILLDFLSASGYIILYKGGVGEYGMVGGKWQATSFDNGYIEILPKLKQLYETHYYKDDTKLSTRENIVIVHDIKGNDVTFRMNHYLTGKRDLLRGYNCLCVTKNVEGREGKIYDVQMHTILKGKEYNKGGRNHMTGEGIQSLSKEERMLLTIEGKGTVIYDYQGFEPSIAYSMCQEIGDGDPYILDLDGYDPKVCRSLCKLFLLVMFNIKDPRYLHSALNTAIREGFNIDLLYSKGKIPDKRIDTKEIVQKLEDKHYLIKHMFYGIAHTEPAYIGSLIADYITDYFTQRGVLVLSVYDEFIIEEDYEDELKEVMLRAYDHVLGFTDNCKIRKEK